MTTIARPTNIHTTAYGLKVLGIFALLAMIACLPGYFWPSANSQHPIVDMLTWTGRLAFLIFLIPMFASPLHAITPGKFSALLMRWRRNAGVAYGGVQVIHFILIIMMFSTMQNPPTEAAMVAIGGMGIVLSMVMLVTSFKAPTRFVGRKLWKGLHKSGFYIFMFIYFYDFVVEPFMLGTYSDTTNATAINSYIPLAAVTLACMLLRSVVMMTAWIQPAKQNNPN